MTKQLLRFLLRRSRSGRLQGRNFGFTLLELLIVTLIAAIIVSGLLVIVNQLLASDQQESSLSETQREMQLALNYMSDELKEAVYVYTGSCLAGTASAGIQCRGLTSYLPDSLSTNGSVPVLAFWKPKQIPLQLRNRCRNVPADNPATPADESAAALTALRTLGVSCNTGSSYALVVYSLKLNNETGADRIWRGKARITRYVLEQFERDSSVSDINAANAFRATTGYVNPSNYESNFEVWPFSPVTNANAQNARPTGNAQVLVDFVDIANAGASFTTGCSISNPNPQSGAPTSYDISPTAAALTTAGLTGVRSFYACVEPAGNRGYRDVALYLRGNANGRPGIVSDTKFIPSLETRVLTRAGLDINVGN